MYVETVALERQTHIESHLPGDGVKTTSGHVQLLPVRVELLERGIDNWWSKPPSHVELGMGYRKQVVTYSQGTKYGDV